MLRRQSARNLDEEEEEEEEQEPTQVTLAELVYSVVEVNEMC